jgi:hypothetical protein
VYFNVTRVCQEKLNGWPALRWPPVGEGSEPAAVATLVVLALRVMGLPAVAAGTRLLLGLGSTDADVVARHRATDPHPGTGPLVAVRLERGTLLLGHVATSFTDGDNWCRDHLDNQIIDCVLYKYKN